MYVFLGSSGKKKKKKNKNPKFSLSRGYVQRTGNFCNLYFNWNAQDRSDCARQGLSLHFSFFFPFFFFSQEWPFKMYLFMYSILHVPASGWLGTFFHGSIRHCENSTPFPAAFLSCLPLCLFGYTQAPVCLGWGNGAVVYELSPGPRYPAAFS